MIERRIRSGRYEWRCNTCHHWYYKLARHIKSKTHRNMAVKLRLNAAYGKAMQHGAV